ncbi:hypothetical protein QZH41_019724 [Actinostola sp. cb2023]|nr:hypothetical protein QZH41_019724 [Actinostola sp. cb2023]
MPRKQSPVAPLTKENVEQLQTQFKVIEDGDQKSKTEVGVGLPRKGDIARSDGDGESVDATHVEQKRIGSGVDENKQMLSLKPNEEEQQINNVESTTKTREDENNAAQGAQIREKSAGRRDKDERKEETENEIDEEENGHVGNAQRPATVDSGKSTGDKDDEHETTKSTDNDDKNDDACSTNSDASREATEDRDDSDENEAEEVLDDDETTESEEEDIDTDPKKPDNLIMYDSADENQYNSDDLNVEYNSADEYAEYENQLREEMENTDSPTSSESEKEPEPEPKERDVDEETATITTSRFSSHSEIDEEENDDDDEEDDDDNTPTEEEEKEDEEEEIDYDYYTSPAESENSNDTNIYSKTEDEEAQSSQGELDEVVQKAIEKELKSDEENADQQEDDQEIINDEVPVLENEDKSHETRPGTRLVSGKSASPHLIEESVQGSDHFDEFEGEVFEIMECNFKSPVLSGDNDELDAKPNAAIVDKDGGKSRKFRKKRRRRRKVLAKLREQNIPLSDTEDNEENSSKDKVLNEERKRKKPLRIKKECRTVSSTSAVGPADTAFSCSSGDDWSENSVTTISSQYSGSSSSHSSDYSDVIDYVSSYVPSPPPITRKKICWPIDGRLRLHPPIRRKAQVNHGLAKELVNFSLFSASHKPSNKKAKKSQSAISRPPRNDDNSTMVKKILSANRNKITKLYNVVEELQQEVDQLRQENKTLKRIHVKQERELRRVDREEGSLPQLLQRHSAELRTYRERLKKNKVVISRKEQESHSHDVELNKLRDKLHHYKELDSDKKLEERASLAKKLQKVEKALNEKDTKIMELQKTIKLSDKARQREIKEQHDRHKKAKDELLKVQENVVFLKEKLKDKEQQLDMTNIYHHNIQQKLKKGNPLALLAAHQEELHIKKDPSIVNSSRSEKKRTKIFLTNDTSDTSSNITAEAGRIQPSGGINAVEISITKKNNSISDEDKILQFETQEAARLKEEFERDARQRREEKEARDKKKEDESLRKEEEHKREEEKMREKK